MNDRIFGHTWEEIQKAQQGDSNALHRPILINAGDYGADPLGDGTFRMVPSGDIVSFEERNRRLNRDKKEL